MTWNERLVLILDESGIKRLEIALAYNVDPVTIHRYKKGESEPNLNFFTVLDNLVFEKIGKRINTDWIIFGRGERYHEQEPSSTGGDQGGGSQEAMHTGAAQTVNVVKEQLQQIREEFKSKMNELEQTLVAVSGKIRVGVIARVARLCVNFASTQKLQTCN